MAGKKYTAIKLVEYSLTLLIVACLKQATIFFVKKIFGGRGVIATSLKPHLTDAKGKVALLSYALSRDKLSISLPVLNAPVIQLPRPPYFLQIVGRKEGV